MDEQLRLVASVQDQFSAPLRRLNSLLGETAKHPAGRWLKGEWAGVSTAFDKVTQGLNVGLNPALSRIGVTSLGVTGAVAGIGAAIKSFAGQTQSLSILSRELGLSTKQLREMKAVGEHFGVPWDAAQGSLKRFQDNLGGLRKQWGETYGKLRGMRLGDLAADLASAPDMQTAIDRALEGIKSIANPSYRRQVAELLFGSDMWATIAKELSPKTRGEIRKMLADLPAGSEEAAEKFNLGLNKMTLGIEELRNQAIAPLMDDINGLIGKLSQPESLAVFRREIKGVTDGVQAFRKEIGHLKEAWDAITSFDVGGALRALRKADGASGPLAERLAPLTGDGRAKQLQDQIRDLEERRSANDVNPLTRGRVPERQAELTREIERLTAELKRHRETGSATVQQQSFDGGGFGGAKLFNASVGGFGGLGRGVWSFNGRTWDRREDPSGRGGRDVFLPPGLGGGRVMPYSGDGPLRGYDEQGRPITGPRERGGSGVPRISPAIPRQALPGGPRPLFGDRGAIGREGANPGAYKEVLDFIAKAEGTAGRGDYNASLGYGRFLPGRKETNLTGMTLDQISALGHHMRRQPGNPNSSALGRYQIVGQTMRGLMKRFGLKGDESFDEKMQDRMAAELARDTRGQPGRLANEWASLRGARLAQAVELMSRVDRSASTSPGSRDGGPPAASRAGDSMMGRAFGPGGVAAGAPKMEATGAVNVHLSGGLEKLPARVSTEGLFRDVKVSRGSQMSAAQE